MARDANHTNPAGPNPSTEGTRVDVGGTTDPMFARRRIIKTTAVAVPMLLTLRSGAALALSSGQQTCLANDKTFAQQSQPALGIIGMDTWVRKAAVSGVVLNGSNGGQTVFCVASDQNQCGINSSNQQAVNPAVWVFADGTSIPVNTRIGNLSSRNVLIYVDDNGNFVSIDPRASLNDRPITGSCWTSLNPLA